MNNDIFSANLPEIIIVDDDEDLISLISGKLNNLGCSISTIAYGREVISKLNSFNNVLLLLDYMLPDMTAMELVSEISGKKNIPFIIMTGYADVKTAVDFMKSGARDYLIKDSDFLDMLPATIMKVLNQLYMERKLAQIESALHESEEKYRSIYNNALVGMMSVRSSDKIITAINDLGCEILGFKTEDDIIGNESVTNILFPDTEESIFQEIQKNGIIYNQETQIKRKNPSNLWCMYSAKLYQNEDKIDIVFTDITKRKEAEEQIYILTNYDQLTKLPNKDFFKTHVQNEIIKCEKRGKETIFSVMCLGIDKFKNINNIYGHEIGNLLLQKVGIMLKSVIFRNDIVSRFEGDKFMILFSDISSRDDIGSLVNKIQEIFTDAFEINNIKFQLSATAGICLYPEDGRTADILIKNSQSSMDVAKERGISAHFFDANFNAEIINSFHIMKELKDAIFNEEFIAYYQPKVKYNGEIVGMESLIRWQSPLRGLVFPCDFISIAEKNGMITEIGNIILKKSCIQNKKWLDMGCKPIKMAVNLSPYQFRQANLVSDIKQILSITCLPPQWLELEITESGITENEKASIVKIKEIHELGISVSIDDFGTGYSSLSKLKDYPIDTLKIDKFFVDNIPFDKKSATIATTIIDLAHNLDFKVVAEGVESEEQLDFLASHKCDFYQGYYFSKPLPPEAFLDKLCA